jgi:hypothetical protein
MIVKRERDRDRDRDRVNDGGGRVLRLLEGRRRQAEKDEKPDFNDKKRDPVRTDRVDRVTSFSR